MLKGKTTLVTGSTSGIGLAITHAPAKDSANFDRRRPHHAVTR